MSEDDGNIKIILIGNSGVGKTAIIHRFDIDKFIKDIASTISSSFIVKPIELDGKKLLLNIWDTAGQERFRSLNKLFIKNSNIIIFVYDVTVRESFEQLNFWKDLVIDEINEGVILGLAGNKVDKIEEEGIEEEVSKEEGKKLAEKWGAHFSLISAKKDKSGIDNFFIELVNIYLEKPNLRQRKNSVKLNKKDFNNKSAKLNKLFYNYIYYRSNNIISIYIYYYNFLI